MREDSLGCCSREEGERLSSVARVDLRRRGDCLRDSCPWWKMSEKCVLCPEGWKSWRLHPASQTNGLEQPLGDIGGIGCFPEAENKAKKQPEVPMGCVCKNGVWQTGGLSEGLTFPWIKMEVGTGFLIVNAKCIQLRQEDQ